MDTCKSQKIKSIFSLWNVLAFLALFLLYICRTPEDSFQAYLFAEDGSVLVTDSIFEGIGSIFQINMSTLWVMQRVLALVCYLPCFLAGNIEYLPYIMAVVFKAIAVLGIMYFTSERFEWIVPKKLYRFLICAAIIAAMPGSAYSLMPCDTSVTFVLVFAMFLVGLDLLCSGKRETLSIPQTCFFVLMALSYAGCVFVGLIAAAVALKWLVTSLREKTFSRKGFIVGLIKLTVILIAVLVQLLCILSGDRVSGELELLRRLYENTKAFVFLPGWQRTCSWGFFVLGLAIWIVILYLSKIPWKTVVYCVLFSFMHLFYCSMVGTVDYFYLTWKTQYTHYTAINVMISVLLLGIAVSFMVSGRDDRFSKVKKFAAIVATAILAIYSIYTFRVDVKGYGYADVYRDYSDMYVKDGEDRLQLQIAPWNLWTCTIPAEISSQSISEDLSFEIRWINRIPVEDYDSIVLNGSEDSFDNILGHISGESAKILYDKCFIKLANGEYRAAYQMDVHDDNDGVGEHNGFSFYVDPNDFDIAEDGSSKFTICAVDTDGQWHVGSVDIKITVTE